MNQLYNILKKENKSIIAFIIILILLSFIWVGNFDKESFALFFKNSCIAAREFSGICCCFSLAVALLIAFSKYGRVKIGGENAEKEFSTSSWISCMIMAGMGIGIMFYSQEPLFHLHSNPYVNQVEGSNTAIAYALTLYNWTFNVWGLYGLLGVIIAYFYYNKKRDLKISSIFPTKLPQWIKNVLDIIMALGIIAGLTTSLGLGVVQLKGGLSYVFNYETNNYILMAIIGIISTWSVNSGLKKGVKWLSNINSYLVIAFLLTALIAGYFSFNINGFTQYIFDGVTQLFTSYLSFNDFWNPNSDEWAASWATFYQLWFAAWAAFVAVFIAKISKGRTIREFILGVVVLPSVLTVIWFGVLGNIGNELKEAIFPMMQTDITKSLFVFIHQLFHSSSYYIVSAFVLVIVCMFFITSSDSSSYVVATLLSNSKASRLSKIIWSCIQCLVAMALFACGGLSLVQSASVLLGILVLCVIVIGSFYFIYTLIKTEK